MERMERQSQHAGERSLPPPYVAPALPPKKKGARHPLAILSFVVLGGVVAFLALGVFLVAIGWEANPLDPVEVDVAGADVLGSYANANGTTTSWFVVVDEATSEVELTRIANDLVTSGAAQGLDDLDITFFDDDGRQLRNYLDASRELDQAAVGDDVSIEELIELVEDLPIDWVEDHSVGVVTTSTVDGSPSHFLCLEPAGNSCTAEELVPVG